MLQRLCGWLRRKLRRRETTKQNQQSSSVAVGNTGSINKEPVTAPTINKEPATAPIINEEPVTAPTINKEPVTAPTVDQSSTERKAEHTNADLIRLLLAAGYTVTISESKRFNTRLDTSGLFPRFYEESPRHHILSLSPSRGNYACSERDSGQ